MADINKERIVRIGEVVILRDASDQANYKQTVGLIRDFSELTPRLIDVEPANQGDEQIETIEVKDAQEFDVVSVKSLPLPVFARRTHLRRVQAKKGKLAKAA